MSTSVGRDSLAGFDWSEVSTGEPIGPVTPGDVPRLDFMAPLNLSARALAREFGVPATLISSILNGARSITARTAILLSRRFATSAEFWMNLQTAHALESARAAMGQAA